LLLGINLNVVIRLFGKKVVIRREKRSEVGGRKIEGKKEKKKKKKKKKKKEKKGCVSKIKKETNEK